MEETKQKNSTVICLLLYIISATLFILLRIGGKYKIFSFLGKNSALILNSINQLLFIAGVAILGFCLIRKQNLKKTFADFRFKKISPKMVWNCVLLGVIMFGIVVIISTIWSGIVSITGYEKPLFFISSARTNLTPFKEFGLGIISTCLLPAFCEEILLRGCVLFGVERLGRKKAIVICGLLFGFLHLNILQLGYTMIMGMFLALITLMMGSIWPAIIIHFTSNFCSVFSNFIYKLNLFDGWLNRTVNMFFDTNFVSLFLNITLISIILIFLFIVVFSKFVTYSRVSRLYGKLQNIVGGNIKDAQRFEFNEENQDNLIKMREVVESEMTLQIENAKSAFDFILPPSEFDSHKTTKLEKTFVVLALCLTGLATLISFVGGIFLC